MIKLIKQSVIYIAFLSIVSVVLIMCGCQKRMNDNAHLNSEDSMSSNDFNDSNSSPDYEDDAEANDIFTVNQKQHLELQKKLQKDRTIAATVNGMPIYKSDVEIELDENITSRENTRIYLESMDFSEDDITRIMEEQTSELLFTEEEILSKMIRSKVLQIQIEERGLYPSDEEISSYAEERYNIIKAIPEAFESAQLKMQILKMSEEDYINEIAEDYKKEEGEYNLYCKMIVGHDVSERDQVYEDIVAGWIAEADIVYY